MFSTDLNLHWGKRHDWKIVLWRFISPPDSILYIHYKWMATHPISFKNERPNAKLHLTRIHNHLWNLVFRCLLKVYSQFLRADLHLVFSHWFQLIMLYSIYLPWNTFKLARQKTTNKKEHFWGMLNTSAVKHLQLSNTHQI